MTDTARSWSMYKAPQKDTIQYRQAFYRLKRENNESIEKWLRRVQECIDCCEFPIFVEFLLIDRFVCGLNNVEMEIIRGTESWSVMQLFDSFLNQNMGNELTFADTNEKPNRKGSVDSELDNDSNGFDNPHLDQNETISIGDDNTCIKIEPVIIIENEPMIYSSNEDIRHEAASEANQITENDDKKSEAEIEDPENKRKYTRRSRRTKKAESLQSDAKQFICDICDTSFHYASNLHAHKKVVHKGIRPHKCEICGKSFPNQFSLKRHLISHTKEKSHTCDICNKLFASSTNLIMHKRTVHDGIREHVCDQCDKAFIHSYLLEQHKQMAHQGVRSHVCKICDKNFSKNSGLKRHHLSAHTEERPFCCDEPNCGKKFTRASILKVHKDSVHDCVRPFVCEICSKSFTLEFSLKTHMITHSGERPFSCDHPNCGKTFTQQSVLKTHKKTVHEGHRPYACDQCDKTTSNLSSLKKHIIVNHTDEKIPKIYMCDLCGKSFAQLYSMKIHKRTIHEGIRDWECDQCKKRFKDRHGLQAHTLIHTGEKNHFCDSCGKSFTSKSNLEKHKRSIHEGLRPHTCMHCDRSYPNRSALKRHSFSHSGTKMYSCRQCGISFDRATDLKTHRKACATSNQVTEASNQEKDSNSKAET